MIDSAPKLREGISIGLLIALGRLLIKEQDRLKKPSYLEYLNSQYLHYVDLEHFLLTLRLAYMAQNSRAR